MFSLQKIIKEIIDWLKDPRNYGEIYNPNLTITSPKIITLELTNHCNLQCIMCPRMSNRGKKMNLGHMDFDNAVKVIDECYENLESITLTDLGETLLYPHLKEVVNYIKFKNDKIKIFIATNANLPNAASVVNSIANKIDILMISIDGIGEVYESIRQKSNYKRFINNVKKISKIRQKGKFALSFNMVVLKENYFQMPEVTKLTKKLNISYIQLNPLNLAANSKWPMSYYNFYFSKKFREKLQETIELAKQEGINLGYPIFPDLKHPKTIRDCPYIWDGFTVSWDGYLSLCCAFNFPKEKNYGNVFKKGLLNCVNNEEMKNIRKAALKGKASKYCRGCYLLTDKIIKNYLSTKLKITSDKIGSKDAF